MHKEKKEKKEKKVWGIRELGLTYPKKTDVIKTTALTAGIMLLGGAFIFICLLLWDKYSPQKKRKNIKKKQRGKMIPRCFF